MNETPAQSKVNRRPFPKPHVTPARQEPVPSPTQTSQAITQRRSGTGAALRLARPLPKPQPRALSLFESELLVAWATS